MKSTVIAFVLLATTSLFSQNVFAVDWKEAPINTIIYGYTLNHNNLKGNIKKVEIYYSNSNEPDYLEFNNQGKMLYYDSYFIDTDYAYDSNGKLSSTSDWLGDLFFTLDQAGRVIAAKDSYESNSTLYAYNGKGLLINSKNSETQRVLTEYSYDNNGRVISYKSMSSSDGKINTNLSYTYSRSGNNLIIATKDLLNGTSTTTTYDQQGYELGTEYDKFGNPIKEPNGNTWRITYWDGTVTGEMPTASTTTIQQPNTTTSSTGCVSGDCYNGWGKWQFNNGYYEGFWINGNRHGYGLYSWDTEGSYVGFFANNMLEGYGSYEDASGKIVVGMYADGLANGLAEQVEDDVWSQGFYKNHSLDTPYDYTNHYKNYGCKAGDCQNGYGQFKWENGDMFSGFFKNGVMNLGSYEFANGDLYKGMFNNSGQFHGQGRYFYDSGGYYGGEWQNGSFHGKGYYHDVNYNKKIGEWQNGILTKAY